MNTPAPNSLVLIPALIFLLAMGIGIVAAFRKRDARVPLGIGLVAFILLGIARSQWVQSSPSPFHQTVSSQVNSTVAPQVMFSSIGVLLLIVTLLVGFALVVAAVRHGRTLTLAIVSSVILLGVFMVGYTKLEVRQGARVSNSITLVPSSPALVSAPTVEPRPERPLTGTDRLATTPSGPTPLKIEYIVGNGPGLAVPELPAWRQNPPREGSTEQGWSKYVVSSQQFATVEEAEAELFQSITTDVQAGFAYHWPETQGWVPTREDILSSGLITEKVIETIPLKVGEFENPVYRVSWLVEFRPEANKALHARWFPLEAERRSRWLLAGLAGITGLLGGTAMILRRQRPAISPEPAQMA